MGGVGERVVNAVFSVEDDRDDVDLFKPKENPEIVPRVLEKLRLHYLWRVILGSVLVILQQRDHLRHGDTGNEHNSRPVVNEAAGNRNGAG